MEQKKVKLSIKDRLRKLIKNRFVQRGLIITVSLLIGLVVFITPIYDSLDFIAYDASMKYVKKPAKEDSSIVLVNIDDWTMNAEFLPFSWPFPRFVYGDALQVMADFGVKGAVFDIEFIGKSFSGADSNMVKSISTELKEEVKYLSDRLNTLKNHKNMALIKPETEKLSAEFKRLDNILVGKLDSLIRDNDMYFSNGIRYNGKVYGTVSLFDNDPVHIASLSESEIEKIRLGIEGYGTPIDSFGKGAQDHPSIKPRNFAIFPYEPILQEYKKIGFTSVDHDKDGATRKISLFLKKDGYVFAQLALAPFLDIHGITPDKIDFSRSGQITLRDVEINGKKKNIVVPVDRDGVMNINFPSGGFEEIFTHKSAKSDSDKESHFSFANLLFYAYKLIPNLQNNLTVLADETGLSVVKQLVSDFNEYLSARETYLNAMNLDEDTRVMLESYFDQILQQTAGLSDKQDEVLNSLNDQLMRPENSDDERMVIMQKMQEISQIFEAVNSSSKNLITFRALLSESLKDKVCFIGHTATGTTDMGATPFDKSFQNVGIHPSVYNNLLTGDFIRVIPSWVIFIFSFIIYSLLIIFLTRKEQHINPTLGIVFVVLLTIFLIAIFRLTNIYISIVVPFIYGVSSFLLLISLKFLLSESEKGFIRNTFSRYLSPEVINELVSDPSKIELGGERRNCTAVFTDVEGFSSISERFMDDPKGLVSLLNDYLSAMSDVILDNGGTIDKYEGDAIIAFFGAPHQMDDHPLKACISSIRMKQIEDSLNKVFLENGLSDRPLKTRIGINTGDMFVGNMGTYKRQDYTMMGHSVNLAARLEGVNKQYNTYQLISEYTYQRVKENVICRKLDRVRVVNINTPIRLYELVAIKGDIEPRIEEFLGNFHKALDFFENREWDKAIEFFQKSIIDSNYDLTTKMYIERAKKFIENPPADKWDGVYSLTVK